MTVVRNKLYPLMLTYSLRQPSGKCSKWYSKR